MDIPPAQTIGKGAWGRVKMRERTAGESYLNFTKSVSYMLRISLSILIVQWFRRRK